MLRSIARCRHLLFVDGQIINFKTVAIGNQSNSDRSGAIAKAGVAAVVDATVTQ